MDAPSPQEFEDEVRRVARALWPNAANGGAEMVNGREVDGLFRTEEVVHLVEASMDRTVPKAHNVGPKLSDHLKLNKSGRGRFAKSWFVTFHEPTAHQREVLHKKYDRNIEVVSFEQFKSRLVDAREYLRLRNLADWGSAAHPENGSQTSLPQYVPLQIAEIKRSARKSAQWTDVPVNRASQQSLSAVDVTEIVLNAGRVALVGDYGAGKSMTLREIHQQLAKRYLDKTSRAFPVTLSLRRHYGQSEPEEALHRHAHHVGYDSPAQLVRAWRAGYMHILLDGFDEMAAPGWSGNLNRLRENRRAATKLIQQFSKMSPQSVGILVSGRRYYFDSLHDLGYTLFENHKHLILSLNDFTPEQADTFIQYFQKWHYAIPPWLPARPLLLGYLAAKNLLSKLNGSDVRMMAPAEGWSWLLDRICEREAFIKPGMDGLAVRAIVERLATLARQTPQGVGPLTAFDLAEAFTSVRKQRPSDEDLTLLQRLPGLGGEENREEGTRRFVDSDLVSAAQAGDIARYIQNPYQEDVAGNPESWIASMEPLGVEVAGHALQPEINEGDIRRALSHALNLGRDALGADIVRIALTRGIDIPDSSGKFPVSGVILPSLELDDEGLDVSGVQFSQCIFSELSIAGEPIPPSLPLFSQCSFEIILGRLGPKDIPPSFHNCEYSEFPDGADRNAAVLNADSLTQGTRVTMALLRKLYLQRGRGRKDSALARGMSTADRELVRPALRLLERERLAVATRLGTSIVWLPDRSAGPRVRRFLESPRIGEDPLVAGAKALTR